MLYRSFPKYSLYVEDRPNRNMEIKIYISNRRICSRLNLSVKRLIWQPCFIGSLKWNCKAYIYILQYFISYYTMSNCDYLTKHFPLFPLIFRNPSAASIETFQFNLFSRVAYACSFSFFRGWNATFTFFFAKCRPSVPLPVPPSLTVHVINGSCHMLASFAVGAILEAAAATAATSATPLANCGSTYVQQQQQQLSTPKFY